MIMRYCARCEKDTERRHNRDCVICASARGLERRVRVQKDPILRAKRNAQMLISARLYHGRPVPTYPCPGYCECCGRTEPGGKGNANFHADHNHVSGEFRGWLCNWCNTGLGLLGDNLEGIKKAELYLIRSAS